MFSQSRFSGILVGLVFFIGVHVYPQNPVDSLENLLSNNKRNSKQLEWVLELIELQLNTNQIESAEMTIDKYWSDFKKDKDPCSLLRIKLLNSVIIANQGEGMALKYMRGVLEEARAKNCKSLEAEALLIMARIHLESTTLDSSMIYVQKAEDLARKLKKSTLIAEAREIRGAYYIRIKNYEKSREELMPSALRFIEEEEYGGAGMAWYQYAYSFYKESQFDSAIYYCEKAIPYLEISHQNSELSFCIDLLAITQQNTGNFEAAINSHFKSLEIGEKYEIESKILQSFYNIGTCYYVLNAKSKAKKNFQLCLTQSESFKDTGMMIYSLNALGEIAIDEKELPPAAEYLYRSYKLAKLVDDHFILFYISLNLAQLEMERGDFPAAQEELNLASDYAKVDNFPAERLILQMAQAELFGMQDRRKEAIVLMNEALEQAREMNSVENILVITKSLSELHEGMNDYENALIWIKQNENLEDSVNMSIALEKFYDRDFLYAQQKQDQIRQLEAEKDEIERRSKLRTAWIISFASGTLVLFLIGFSLALNKLMRRYKRVGEDLKEANQTKDKLFSIIAHDLRSPFNTLKGFASLLMEEEPEEEVRQRYYLQINKSSDHLLDLISNLMEWSMSQSGSITVTPGLFKVRDTVDTIVKFTQDQARIKQITLVRDSQMNEVQEIFADENLVKRILQNLMTNAIKFSNQGGTIHIGWRIDQTDYVFWVTDQGIGMSEEDARQLLSDNFTNKVIAGTQGEKGTGLGLNVCKEFIKLQGGTIWIDSTLGEGSSIYFSLPKPYHS